VSISNRGEPYPYGIVGCAGNDGLRLLVIDRLGADSVELSLCTEPYNWPSGRFLSAAVIRMAAIRNLRTAAIGRVCEVADGRFVEFRCTEVEFSGTTALEKVEWLQRVDFCPWAVIPEESMLARYDNFQPLHPLRTNPSSPGIQPCDNSMMVKMPCGYPICSSPR